MLGKLLKYEIKHSARYTMVIYGVTAIFALITGIALIANSTWLGVTGCFALYVAGIASVVVTLVSVIKNFYDTLYGRQGYLTFTLPVKCSTLLLSKVIVSFLWIIVSFLIMAATYLLIFLYAKDKSEGMLDSIMGVFAVSGLMELLPSKAVLIQVVLMVALLAILTILTYVGFVYFSVTVANTRPLQSHPKLFGGLVFFGVFFLTSSIGNKLTEALPLTFNVATDRVFFAFKNMFEVENVLLSYGVGGTIFSGIIALGLLFATGYIMEHKVNLK